jgi:CRISPR system Cascade subunit CasA
MPFSLLQQPWLPVLRASGPANIRPAQITEHLTTDPVIAINWPRADFRLASLEFLIGLLAVACPPVDQRGWAKTWRAPPSPEVLEAAFAPLADAFNLDGDGPRFMQDFEDFSSGENGVAALLIEAPGEQTTKKNADLLNKRGQVETISRAAAAMALFTLQTYAPAGGAGNRTGLRGGGPLTTLAIPPGLEPLPLWYVLWANVPACRTPEPVEFPRIFPWLAPTLTSETNRKVARVSDPDPLAFWAAPRRIRLVFSAAAQGEICDLTGATDDAVVRLWRQRPYGANYEDFDHPLTPHYRQKSGAGWLPVHPQPGGIGYRHFLGLVVSTEQNTLLKPAAAIAVFRSKRFDDCRPPGVSNWRILAAGFDMDNMKARSFVEAEMPVYEPDDPERREEQDERVAQYVNGAKQAADNLRAALRMALFAEGAKPNTDAGMFAVARGRFWSETEAAFYEVCQSGNITTFLRDISRVCLEIFDDTVPILDSDHPARVADAARYLGLALHGYNKSGNALFDAFGLPRPDPGKTPKTKEAAA